MIAAGHNFDAIKKYKLRQANSFLELFKTRNGMMLKEMSIAVRMAHHAEGKDFMKFIDTE